MLNKAEKKDKSEDFYAVVTAIVKFIEEADKTASEGVGLVENSK